MSWKKKLMRMDQELQTPQIGGIMSEIAERVRMDGRDVINLAPGLPDFQPPDHIYEAIRKPINQRSFPIHGAPGNGLPGLREAICEKLKRERSVDFAPTSEIVITNGAFHAFSMIMQATIEAGDEVVITRPGFYFHEPIAISGAVPVFVDLRKDNGWKLDPENVESKLTSRTKVLLVNTPHNPTGHVMSKSELEGIADIAKRHDLLVVQDDVYAEFVYDGLEHHEIAAFPDMKERTILLNSFSKSYCLYNWRVGYMASDKTIMRVLQRVLNRTVLTVNYLAQVAASAALEGPQGWIHTMVNEFQQRRDLLVSGLNKLGLPCLKPEGTIVVLPDITRFESDSIRFAKYVLEKTAVQTQPGVVYSAEGHLRIALGEKRQRIEEALERIRIIV
jgi:aspartate/methionine/tyrosine aminotransferase